MKTARAETVMTTRAAASAPRAAAAITPMKVDRSRRQNRPTTGDGDARSRVSRKRRRRQGRNLAAMQQQTDAARPFLNAREGGCAAMSIINAGLKAAVVAAVALLAFASPSGAQSSPKDVIGAFSQHQLQAGNCAPGGSPCSDPRNNRPQWPVCARDCCSGGYYDCDGIACICK
jgi:hypothetical protein